MLGHLNSAGSNHESDGRRDIEATGSATAGPTGINDRLMINIDVVTIDVDRGSNPDRGGMGTHNAGGASNLGHRLPFMRKAVIKAPICAAVAAPLMI